VFVYDMRRSNDVNSFHATNWFSHFEADPLHISLVCGIISKEKPNFHHLKTEFVSYYENYIKKKYFS
jgi:hypothetical protein